MTDLQARVHHLLWHHWHSDISNEQREAYRNEVIDTLHAHPELDAWFLDRYVTRHVEEWELDLGLMILTHVGHTRRYDHELLVKLLYRDGISMHDKRSALFCVTQMAN